MVKYANKIPLSAHHQKQRIPT